MAELYLRKVVVEILPKIGIGKKIENLRVQFTCEKNTESTPNKCEVMIFNLSDGTRSILEAKDTRVKLSIGYLGLNPEGLAGTGFLSSSSVELVFVGTVEKVTNEIATPDIITKIELKDGGSSYRNARIEKGYPPNIRLETVVNDLVLRSGLQKGSVTGISRDKVYSNGLTLSGLIRDQLDILTRSNDLEWSIQNESIQITKRKSATPESPIYLDPESGLIGSPSKTDKGVEFKSLIQPNLKPGRLVQVNSRFVKGIYRLTKVVHQGDSYSGDFVSICESNVNKKA